MGNRTPLADLMVVSPIRKEMFLVDVKGLYQKNPWIIKRKPVRDNLYYILAFVPTDEENQFFIMTQKVTHLHIHEELRRLNRSDDYPLTGIGWSLALQHEDAWKVLPR
jgi:hypothetical protein